MKSVQLLTQASSALEGGQVTSSVYQHLVKILCFDLNFQFPFFFIVVDKSMSTKQAFAVTDYY